ncbi:MAG: plastocyanin/azurin family copper-binding protein [Thermoanaerobaculia bacterium]
MRTRRNTLLIAALASLLIGTFTRPVAAEEPRTIRIAANDAMQFSVKKIQTKPGEKLRVVLTAQGSMTKTEMAHNWVLLAAGTSADGFVGQAAMARASDYIPPAAKAQILAATGLAGAGESVTVDFVAPDVPGTYVFLCTFPGHFAGGMKGTLIVAN